MAIRRCAYLIHVNAIIIVLVACCYAWGHVISAWNRCHSDCHVVLYNRKLEKCLKECAVRDSCVAVQYNRLKLMCGIVTSSEIDAHPLVTCVGFVYIRRSDMNLEEDEKTCDRYEQSSTDNSCITECTVPDNPRIYSKMEGFPTVGSRIQLTCLEPTTPTNQSLLCQPNGEFEGAVSECQVPDNTNLAFRKPATQSSTASGGKASRAVDGITDGVYTQGSCTHTVERAAENPWWVVDLQNAFRIRAVEIHNRLENDCCSNRLQNVYIYASTTDNLKNHQMSGALCANKTGPFDDSVILFQCQGDVVGRYLKIILDEPAEMTLTLCEVKVFGDTI